MSEKTFPEEEQPESPQITEPIPANPEDGATPIDPERSADNTSLGTAGAKDNLEPEDLLEDVRHSLIEEEQEQAQHQPAWWQKFGRKNKKPAIEEPSPAPEIDLPVPLEPVDLTSDQIKMEERSEIHGESIEDLMQLLQKEADEGSGQLAIEPESAPPVPEPVIDFDQLKKQAFEPRPAGEGPETFSEVRSVTLSDGEEVFVEVHSEVSDPLKERLSAFENALKPYKRYIYLAFTFLGIVAVVITSLILWDVYKRSLPPPTPVQQAANLPYPVSIALPGGWTFDLGRGALQDGQWKPQGPEWLEGTEICRWVGLPWSEQLEAVVRTLNQDDSIELIMSNNDKLTYKVYSVEELTPEQMQKLDSSSPCLLLILTQEESDSRWVLTALP